MTGEIVSVKPQDLAFDVAAIMAKRGISQLPVMDGNRPVGLITEGGLLEAQCSKPLNEIKAKEVMVEVPPVVSPATPATAIIGLLRFFPAVLVSKDNELLGIITKSDLLKVALH